MEEKTAQERFDDAQVGMLAAQEEMLIEQMQEAKITIEVSYERRCILIQDVEPIYRFCSADAMLDALMMLHHVLWSAQDDSRCQVLAEAHIEGIKYTIT